MPGTTSSEDSSAAPGGLEASIGSDEDGGSSGVSGVLKPTSPRMLSLVLSIGPNGRGAQLRYPAFFKMSPMACQKAACCSRSAPFFYRKRKEFRLYFKFHKKSLVNTEEPSIVLFRAQHRFHNPGVVENGQHWHTQLLYGSSVMLSLSLPAPTPPCEWRGS